MSADEELTEFDPAPFAAQDVSLRYNVPLSQLGTFQLGGPVRWLIECGNPETLSELRCICKQQGIHALLIGEGSNLLFSDAGWPGLLVRFAHGKAVPTDEGKGCWRFSASANLQQVVDWAAMHGWCGLEAFNGIPGTLGGAVVGNAGAWGVQMEHVLQEIRGVDAAGNVHDRPLADCGFSYRNSKLKYEDFWVSEAVLKLNPGDPKALEAERTRILTLREARHPNWQTLPCIGSFFKNLEPSSAAERRQAAGFFLEQAGAKAQKVGGAGVFSGHANILVKEQADCSAADVAALARRLQSDVKATQGIALEREVRYLGPIPGEKDAKGFY